MKHPDLKSILDTALDIAANAGEILRHALEEDFSIVTKSTRTDMVTDVDTRTENYILNRIHDAFPEHGILAEESGVADRPESDFRWIIDPLDGTNNFVHGIPHFSTSIALYQAKRPLVGVILDPMRDECFFATQGGGAFLRRAFGQQIPIKVSRSQELYESIVATGFPYDKHETRNNNLPEFSRIVPRLRGVRRMGSAALDCAYVAAGRLDGYWESGIKEWDIAAGRLLVLEAGGTVSTVKGPRPVHLFTNGQIHRELAELLLMNR